MKHIFLCSRLTIILFLGLSTAFLAGCPKDEPCTTCPPPVGGDSLIVTETFVTQGIHPAISPDGKKLAFSINGDIYTCDTAGFNAKQLTFGADYDELPQWHPGGSLIGFVRTSQANTNTGIICTVDTNGAQATPLIQDYFVADSLLLESAITAPIWNWSPDGNKIAFLNIVDRITFLRLHSFPNPTEIKSIQLYDSRSTATSHDYSGFSFSPSGNQILFTKQGESLVTHLFKTSTNSDTTIQQLSEELFAAFPTWSNLEDKISFIYPMHFAILSDMGQLISETIGNVNRNPKWSPNGKYILSESSVRVGGANGYVFSRLYLTPSDLQKEFALTTTGDDADVFVHNYFYVWNPDSNIVYYQKFKKIYRINFYFKTQNL